MGKVKNFFRRKQMSEKVQKQVAEAKREAAEKKSRKRRFCLLAEDVFVSTRLQGVMVIGNIHGRVRVGDTMYLYQKDQPVKEVTVLELELGPRDPVETAKDCQVGLCLNLEKEEDVAKYAVLSSIKPLEGEMAERVIENQRLFGLMMEYSRLYTNSAYMDELLYELCYAKFLLPLYMEKPPVPQEDGTLLFPENSFAGFRPLKKADEDDKLVFPAFTDELATMAWKEAFHEGQPKRFATMRLPHVIQQVRQSNYAGLVVNAFGPVPVYFPMELLEQVEKSEVFFERHVKPALQRRAEKRAAEAAAMQAQALAQGEGQMPMQNVANAQAQGNAQDAASIQAQAIAQVQAMAQTLAGDPAQEEKND